jgi:hypothetical protein
MADRETKIVNFYESTLASLLASGATSTTLTTAPTTNGTTIIDASSGDSSSHYYLVVDPDNSSNREVILVTQSTGTTLTTVTRDLEARHTTDPDHQAGTTVRMAVLAEHFADMNDRLDTGLTSLASAIQTSDLQDDDTFASPGADKVASSESIKAYVDTQDATKLSLAGGTMTGAINAGDQEISAAVLKDYAETDVVLSSASGVVAIDLANGNTGSLTLTENVTDIDFTNVPTNGVSSFTVKVTQDASSAYTVAINAITVNGGGDVTAKTAGAGGFTMTATLSAEDLLFFLFFDAGTPYLTATQEMS